MRGGQRQWAPACPQLGVWGTAGAASINARVMAGTWVEPQPEGHCQWWSEWLTWFGVDVLQGNLPPQTNENAYALTHYPGLVYCWPVMALTWQCVSHESLAFSSRQVLPGCEVCACMGCQQRSISVFAHELAVEQPMFECLSMAVRRCVCVAMHGCSGTCGECHRLIVQPRTS